MPRSIDFPELANGFKLTGGVCWQGKKWKRSERKRKRKERKDEKKNYENAQTGTLADKPIEKVDPVKREKEQRLWAFKFYENKQKVRVPDDTADGLWKYWWNTNHISVYMGFNIDEQLNEGEDLPESPF